MAKLTQKQKILEHLKTGRSISQLEASDYMRITDLAGRIRDLRAEGHIIDSTRMKSENDHRYVRYVLRREPEQFTFGSL